MGPTSRFFVAALNSTYRWDSSVTPGSRGAKRPPVRATGINGEILKYHSGTLPARRRHYVYLRPPGSFKFACIVGDRDNVPSMGWRGGWEAPLRRGWLCGVECKKRANMPLSFGGVGPPQFCGGRSGRVRFFYERPTLRKPEICLAGTEGARGPQRPTAGAEGAKRGKNGQIRAPSRVEAPSGPKTPK